MNTTCCSSRSYLNSERNILYLLPETHRYTSCKCKAAVSRHTEDILLKAFKFSRPVKKFLAFCGTGSFTNVSSKARNWTGTMLY
jgi:hypothetical protein